MDFAQYNSILLPAIEVQLQHSVEQASGPGLEEMHQMLAYHMGWIGQGAGPKARGKRIRPLIVLLTSAAAGGDWEPALPAAAAVELVHNFSLIHDDIQDNSPVRRGRPTLWTKWGIPQAINTGDAMFTLAHITILELEKTLPPTNALRAAQILQNTCLRLTQGQYMDISYENRGDLSLEAYWPMVKGKTAALLSTCPELGALVADADIQTQTAYREFGHYLGLAFQVLDDFLGIWGDASVIGKSNASDLLTGKKSLPVLFGLAQDGPFSDRWSEGLITPEEVPDIASQLETEGAREYTLKTADTLTKQALSTLELASPHGKAGEALAELANLLLKRQV
jgi:geranylgeranyl diphosphate synthase type I